MLKPNTPLQSQKFLTEKMMSNPVKTGISVVDLENFEFFLDSSGLDKVRIGFYNVLLSTSPAHVKGENRIVYEIPNDRETQELATIMTLSYGSIEQAYREFRDSLENRTMSSIVNYGY